MMTETQAVLRFRDGRTEKVQIAPIDPARELVRATHEDGSIADVPFSELKAIFFPRTEPEESLEAASGSTISIEFTDGEVIRGAANYNPERNGFFLFPLDRGKNDRIFVVNSAIMSIEVEKL